MIRYSAVRVCSDPASHPTAATQQFLLVSCPVPARALEFLYTNWFPQPHRCPVTTGPSAPASLHLLPATSLSTLQALVFLLALTAICLNFRGVWAGDTRGADLVIPDSYQVHDTSSLFAPLLYNTHYHKCKHRTFSHNSRVN